MDITRKPEIERAYDVFIRKSGPIDLVINAAGIMDDRKLRLTVEINLVGLALFHPFKRHPHYSW